jgi:hypothetical protein
VFLDLLGQIDAFIEEQGEANFYTGPARAMRDLLAGKQPAEHLQRGLDKFLAERDMAGVTACPHGVPHRANWTVHSRVDCYHEPEFPGDLAEFMTIWRAELNHVQLRPGNFTCDDCEEFDTEAEARAYCDRMNAAAGAEGGR